MKCRPAFHIIRHSPIISLVVVWHCGNGVACINKFTGPVSSGMGDCRPNSLRQETIIRCNTDILFTSLFTSYHCAQEKLSHANWRPHTQGRRQVLEVDQQDDQRCLHDCLRSQLDRHGNHHDYHHGNYNQKQVVTASLPHMDGFSRILQVVPMCTPYIESQKWLPWQHPLEPRNRLCLNQIA